MSKRIFFSLLTFGTLLNACASQIPPIMTDEKFDSRVTDEGRTEFVYGISWKNTSQESLIRDGRKKIKRPGNDERFPLPDTNQLALQANNQTKLDLEDQAAEALQKRLIKEQLCTNGYEISNVFWKADSIRLLGHCF